MTTLATGTGLPAPALDLSATPRVPLGRLVGVELRKLGDTRAGRWLLVAIAVVTASAIVIFSLNTSPSGRSFIAFAQVTAAPQGFLLPVLGILLVTSEWSQRCALVTFTLEPVRARVIAAKVLAAVVAGLAAIVVALAMAAVATLVSGGSGAWDGVSAVTMGKFALLQTSGVLQGVAFGLVFLASATAIVTYFVLPSAFSIVAGLWSWLGHARPWLDLNAASEPLYNGKTMDAEQWAQFGTGTALWVLLPFLLGLARVLRAEVK